MRSPNATAGADTSGLDNPFLRAHAGWDIHCAAHRNTTSDTIMRLPVTRVRRMTLRQQNRLSRLSRGANASSHARHQAFVTGAARFETGSAPTIGDLVQHTAQRALHTRPPIQNRAPDSSLGAVMQASHTARASVIQERTALVNRDAYGQISRDKADNTIRIMYENFSSLGVFAEGSARHKKIRRLNELIAEFGVDLLSGCETRTDWRFVTKEEDRFGNLFGNGAATKGIAACNTNDEKIRRDQWGGTCLVAAGRLSSFVTEVGADTSGLGRWSWVYAGGGGKFTRLIVAYQPCDPRSRRVRGDSVWAQHARYFEARGEVRNPRVMFHADLISLLRRWKAAGDEILLMGDFNENVYTGPLSVSLSADDLRMTELCQRITGDRLPATHSRGRTPINAIYGTAGIQGAAAALLSCNEGIGDHRVFVLDITSESILGDVFPRVLPAKSRLLNCASDKMKGGYNAVLNQLANRHLIFKKLLDTDRAGKSISLASCQLRLNKIDLEMEQFMKSSERDCHKYKRDCIEWSPYTKIWWRRRWLLQRVQRFMSGRIRDPRNLFRECRSSGIKDPRVITQDELNAEFYVCKQNLETLAKNGPYFRLRFLKDLISSARRSGDSSRAMKISGIVQKEAARKRWRRINRSTGKARGALTVRVKVPTCDGGVEEFTTEAGVYGAVSAVLMERFQSAMAAQCHRGTFFEDIGHLADGPVAQQILEGTYAYPPDLDPATRLLFEEAAATYAALSPTEIATYVTPEDFQQFWQHARERTGSSYSGLHFGHYIAASFCPDLALLHAAKLTICAKNGVSLARWGMGLTVLLEKILGNVFVHKLRAICLLEADFNWWNKLIFAKRMMHQAIADGSIPQECFAKKYSHCDHAVLTKQFFCNSSRVLHHPAGLGECDFGDCYDRAAHPPTSIALQSWGIPKPAIRVLLSTMQTMQYVLKTGFGESSESYGGTVASPLSGLGQGSGASPPAFMALSALIVNAYRRMGHGARVTSSYATRLFLISAVMYVDDTDLLHWPESPAADTEELIHHVQEATMDYGRLAQASGGILKENKCSVYFLAYKYPGGRARMRSLHDLPAPTAYVLDGEKAFPSHIYIPQPDGSESPIITHEVTTASKMLGVHFSPAGNSLTHVSHMVQKGLDWVDCLRTKPVSRSDAWLSFYLQLFPGISWGLATVCMPPTKLDSMLQRVYAKALPFLGVNCKIKRAWRTLPER